MSQPERIFQLNRMLHARHAVSLRLLMEELGVSRATVVRDIQYLRDRMLAPVVFDREQNGYRIEGESTLPALYLSAAEIHALLVLQHLVTRIQPAFLDEHSEPLRALLRKLLGKDDAAAGTIGNRIRVLQVAARPVVAAHFQAVCQALLDRRRLHLRYHARTSDQESERDVSPQRLVFYRGNWYLDAWCHARKGLRSFSLDAIRHAVPLAAKARDIHDAELDRVLGAGYGIFSGGTLRTAVLRFAPAVARWIASEKWHSRQQGELESDGSYLLRLPYSDDRELVMDILRYGADVEVLEPSKLRARVAEALRRAAKQYAPE